MFSGVSGVKDAVAFSLNDCNSFVCSRVSGAATQQHKAKKSKYVMVRAWANPAVGLIKYQSLQGN